jgi:hypothetical protein
VLIKSFYPLPIRSPDHALANEDQRCVVSHPDAGGPCGEPAIGTVWNLCFCRAHFAEAEAAALEEIYEDAERALELLASLENERHLTNRVLACLLEERSGECLDTATTKMRRRHEGDHKEALRQTFPIVEGRIDPDTLAFDYERDYAEICPVDWWWESHWLLTRFMRLSQERGCSELIKMLEPLRERAAAQILQAERDLEERWTAPRRAKRAEEAGIVDGG